MLAYGMIQKTTTTKHSEVTNETNTTKGR
jgi:hypothetical protein